MNSTVEFGVQERYGIWSINFSQISSKCLLWVAPSINLLKVMGLIDSIVSCQELCDSIVAEAEAVINERLSNCVTQTADER